MVASVGLRKCGLWLVLPTALRFFRTYVALVTSRRPSRPPTYLPTYLPTLGLRLETYLPTYVHSNNSHLFAPCKRTVCAVNFEGVFTFPVVSGRFPISVCFQVVPGARSARKF